MKFVIVLLFAAVLIINAEPADDVVVDRLSDEMPEGAQSDELLDGIAYDEIIEVPNGQPLPKGAIPFPDARNA